MHFLRKVRRLIIDSLGFSKTEANGFLVLLAIVFLVGIVPRIYFYTNQFDTNETPSGQSLGEWSAEMNRSISEEKQKKSFPTRKISVVQKSFNPNKANVEEMIQGGLPKYLANQIANYRGKGGSFREVNDLKKMYGMTDSLFAHVKAYIKLPTEGLKVDFQRDSSSYKPKWEKKEVARFQLNLVTAEELQAIRGIGSFLSGQIIEYRDLLGGYYSTDQLKEVWGLEEEVIQKVTGLADFDIHVETITVNTDSIKTLAKHPYINYNLARAIINYRQVHGSYKSLEELLKIKVMNDSLYQKLSPYLSLQ